MIYLLFFPRRKNSESRFFVRLKHNQHGQRLAKLKKSDHKEIKDSYRVSPLTHKHTHTHPHSHTHTLTHSHTHTLTHSHTHPQAHTHTHPYKQKDTLTHRQKDKFTNTHLHKKAFTISMGTSYTSIHSETNFVSSKLLKVTYI